MADTKQVTPEQADAPAPRRGMDYETRQRKRERIAATSLKLTELAQRYQRLTCLTQTCDTTDPFIELTDAAGLLVMTSLSELVNLLDLLGRAHLHDCERPRPQWNVPNAKGG